MKRKLRLQFCMLFVWRLSAALPIRKAGLDELRPHRRLRLKGGDAQQIVDGRRRAASRD